VTDDHVRDEHDVQAAALFAQLHEHRDLTQWDVTCPGCVTNPAEAFRLGYRAALDLGGDE